MKNFQIDTKYSKLLKISTSILLAMVPVSSMWALGLGDIQLSSHLNEPFHAQVKVIGQNKLDYKQIKIQLADQKYFEKESVPFPDYLTDFDFNVESDSKGQFIIKVSSLRPVREPFVDFLMQVNSPEGSITKHFTVLLDPVDYVYNDKVIPSATKFDKQTTKSKVKTKKFATSKKTVASKPTINIHTKATPTKIASKSIKNQNNISLAFSHAQALSNPSQKAKKFGPLLASQTMWSVAKQLRPNKSVSIEQTLIALWAKNPKAFNSHNINRPKAGKYLLIPTLSEIKSIPSRLARIEVQRQVKSFKQKDYANERAQLNFFRNKLVAAKFSKHNINSNTAIVKNNEPVVKVKNNKKITQSPTIATKSIPSVQATKKPEKPLTVLEPSDLKNASKNQKQNKTSIKINKQVAKNNVKQKPNAAITAKLKEITERLSALEQSKQLLEQIIQQKDNKISKLEKNLQIKKEQLLMQDVKNDLKTTSKNKISNAADKTQVTSNTNILKMPANNKSAANNTTNFVEKNKRKEEAFAPLIDETKNAKQPARQNLTSKKLERPEVFSEKIVEQVPIAKNGLPKNPTEQNLTTQTQQQNANINSSKEVKSKSTKVEEKTSGIGGYLLFFTIISTAGALYYRRRKKSNKTNPAEEFEFVDPEFEESIESQNLEIPTTASNKESVLGAFDLDDALDAINEIQSGSDSANKAIDDTEEAEFSISEIDIYINYGRYEMAQSMLQKMLKSEPDNLDCKVRLLEVYSHTQQEQKFETLKNNLPALSDIEDNVLLERLQVLLNNGLNDNENTNADIEQNQASAIIKASEINVADDIYDNNENSTIETDVEEINYAGITQDFVDEVNDSIIGSEMPDKISINQKDAPENLAK